MSDIELARRALTERVLQGQGKTSASQRRAAFDDADLPPPLAALVDKVARHSYRVTDDDIRAVRASGLTEDEVFELVVCAAIGQASRQYDAALEALAQATHSDDDAPRDPR